MHTSKFSQITGSENYVLSTTTSGGVSGLPVHISEAMVDVITTLFTDGTFAHDLRTLSVSFTAGSII